MPINTDLNIAPYFDDYERENQYYRILFKPAYAVQARELTQLQTVLQNQIEVFGENIFKEGSIVKGCNFTELDELQYVKLVNSGVAFGSQVTNFDPTQFEPEIKEEDVGGEIKKVRYVYEAEGQSSGLKASIILGSIGFTSRPPNLNTFHINYLNSTSNFDKFDPGENLYIYQYKFIGEGGAKTLVGQVGTIQVAAASQDSDITGNSFAIVSDAGIIFQRGHFLYVEPQSTIVSKYSNSPTDVHVGFEVSESRVTALQDSSLYDNANGENSRAPGADRLKLVPTLVTKTTTEAAEDSTFFTLRKYSNGNAVQIRDVSQYNVLAEEMAKRTVEESGSYVVEGLDVKTVQANTTVTEVSIGTGIAYVDGYRVENRTERFFELEDVTRTANTNSQPVSFNYGGYIPVLDFNGTPDFDFQQTDLRDENGLIIGSCFVQNIEADRIYIFGVDLTGSNTVKNIKKIGDSATNYVEVGNTTVDAVVQDSKNAGMVFDTGLDYCKAIGDITLPVRTKGQFTHTSGVVTVNVSSPEDFTNGINDQRNLVAMDTNYEELVISNVSTPSTTELRVNVARTAANGGGNPATTDVILYYNKNISGVAQRAKISREPYVKVNFSTSTNKYSLGFPDVYKIESIVDASNKDFTNSFRLRTNQKDHYYDISYMEHIQGREKPANGAVLTVKLKVFEQNTGSGTSFFTVNSYTNVDADSIPVFVSPTSGARYNLRECLDFRPYAVKAVNVDYTHTTPAQAGTVALAVDSGDSFPVLNYTIPAQGCAARVDIEHYSSRVDFITLDSYGNFQLVKGTEVEQNDVIDDKNKMKIADVIIPGYPHLSSKEARLQNKQEYAVKAFKTAPAGYKMKDIDRLKKRVDALEYYVQLNSLETETKNLEILDENGLTRFKNGFIVDPLNDLSVADITNPEFDAAIHSQKGIMTPSLTQFPIHMKYKTSSGATIFPSTTVATSGSLQRDSNVEFISQPYATNYRNCVSNFYSYQGQGFLKPEFDATPDLGENPEPISLDLLSIFDDYTENLSRFIPALQPQTTITTEAQNRQSTGGFFGFFAGLREQRRETITVSQNTVASLEAASAGFVTNVSMKQYMKGNEIGIHMTSLRPDTQHWIFFDGQDVNEFCAPGTLVGEEVEKFGEYGQGGTAAAVGAYPIMTDASGTLNAVFQLPENTFFTGERKLEVVDVDSYDSIDSGATSKGQLFYRAYNLNLSAGQVRIPQFSTRTDILSSRTTAWRWVTFDPLAQTFFIKNSMAPDSNTIVVSKLDLYFKRKSATSGVTVMLREVVNGYPSPIEVPFSRKHLEVADVNISDDASAVTEITFDNPVRLFAEKEYAIVILPDGNDPDYLVFTSKVGGTDLTPGATQGQSVVQDWGDGVLFTSTNDRAWKSEQDEDIKFKLYRHNFSSSTGSVTLEPDDYEFLTLTAVSGVFEKGEKAYMKTGVTSNVSLTAGDTTVTGGSGLDTSFVAGDYVLIRNSGGTSEDVIQITSIASATELELKTAPFFTDASSTMELVVAGRVSHHSRFDPTKIHIRGSSARGSYLFSAGLSDPTLYGLKSGETATVSSTDNIELSYIQPLINISNDSSTRVSGNGTYTDPNNNSANYDKPVVLGGENYFAEKGVTIYSKTNKIGNSLNGLFDIQLNMENGSVNETSPIIDIESSQLLAYQYNINDGQGGQTPPAYVSKTVELNASFDAEDFQLILTAHKPIDTGIKVYLRAQNAYDRADFNTLDWHELELIQGEGLFSSSTNMNDFREYKYQIASSHKNSDGVFHYGANNNYVGFRRFAVKIEMTSNKIEDSPTVLDYRGIALT